MIYNDVDFNYKTILITGAAGFIGSNLALYFQNNFPKANIIALDRFRSQETFSNGNLKSFGHFNNLLSFKGTIISANINDTLLLKKLETQYKFDFIFHQAAISDTTVTEQDIMIKTNVNAYEELLKIAINHNANMIYASSGATYGNAPSPQTVGKESPNNVYGFSKLMMDNISYSYMKKNLNISIVGLRYFNVYGSKEFFKNKTASTILQFGQELLKGNDLKLFEGSDKILRDFIYIKDIIQGNIKASKPQKSGVYNLGTGKARSFKNVADILQKELNTNVKIKYIPNPYIGQYQFHTQANIEETKKNLNFAPSFTLEDGIKDYIPEIKTLFKL